MNDALLKGEKNERKQLNLPIIFITLDLISNIQYIVFRKLAKKRPKL